MPQLPTPLRAALGLAAEAAEQARHLPDKAIELPMLAVSTALQLSLRAQQRYSMLAAKGDDILNHRETTDEPPPWATFDDPVEGPTGWHDPARPTPVRSIGNPRRAADAAATDVPATDVPAGDGPEPIVDEPAAPGKSVNRPRKRAPSRFDAIGDG